MVEPPTAPALPPGVLNLTATIVVRGATKAEFEAVQAEVAVVIADAAGVPASDIAVLTGATLAVTL